jgi:hypothetical protein
MYKIIKKESMSKIDSKFLQSGLQNHTKMHVHLSIVQKQLREKENPEITIGLEDKEALQK